MSLSKQAEFDRREWLNRLRTKVTTNKVVTIILSSKGASLTEIKSFLGNKFEVRTNADNTVTIAVKQAEPKPAE